MKSLTRKSESGIITVAFMLCGMWVAAVFTGGITHEIVASAHNKAHAIIDADGYAPNDPSHPVDTRKLALADAQKNAIEKAVGVFVSAHTMVDKAITVESKIDAASGGRIEKYEITSEGLNGDVYEVRIQAHVAVAMAQY